MFLSFSKRNIFFVAAIILVVLFSVSYSLGVIQNHSFSIIGVIYAEGDGGGGDSGGGDGGGGDSGGGSGGGGDSGGGDGGSGGDSGGGGGSGDSGGGNGSGDSGGGGSGTDSGGGNTGNDSGGGNTGTDSGGGNTTGNDSGGGNNTGSTDSGNDSGGGNNPSTDNNTDSGGGNNPAPSEPEGPFGNEPTPPSPPAGCPVAAPTLTGAATISATIGQAFAYTFQTTATPQQMSVAGAPNGVGFDAFTNRITGTPTMVGTFSLVITATNECGSTQILVTLTVAPAGCPVVPPSISGNGKITANVGDAMSYTFTTTGTITATNPSGTLPAGLNFNPATFEITGTPTQAGTFHFTVEVGNQCGSDTKTVEIKVRSIESCPLTPPTVSGETNVSITLGGAIDIALGSSGTVATTTTSGSLPGGVTFNPSTLKISGVPNATGTFTFTVTVKNDCGEDTHTVTITVTGGGGGGCALPVPTITPTGETRSVTTGNSFAFSFNTTGTITGTSTAGTLPPGVVFNPGTYGLSGTTTTAGTFTFSVTVSNDCGNSTASITITIADPGCTVNCGGGGGGCTVNCGGGGGGGGGASQPTVLLLKAGTSTLASFGSIYLSQVPYTGLADGLVTTLFLGLLLLISMAIAYAAVYRERFFADTRALFTYCSNLLFGTPIREVAYETPRALTVLDIPDTSILTSSAVIPFQPTFVEAPAAIASQAAVRFSDQLADDIRRGLSEVVGVKRDGAAPATGAVLVPLAYKNHLMDVARRMDAMLEEQAVEIIIVAADHDLPQAEAILSQIVSVAREWYPARNSAEQSTLLLLSKEKVQKILFSTYLSMVPSVIRWLAEGNQEKLFAFVRLLNVQGHSLVEFVKAVLYELDATYRFRMERAEGAQEAVVQATNDWNRRKFDHVIAALVHATDTAYSSEYVSAKLAFTKAFDALNREQQDTALLS